MPDKPESAQNQNQEQQGSGEDVATRVVARTPRPGRFRGWFLLVLIAWWVVGCGLLVWGGHLVVGAVALFAEGLLVAALDSSGLVTLHGLLGRRPPTGAARVALVLVLCALAPIALVPYLAIAAVRSVRGMKRAEQEAHPASLGSLATEMGSAAAATAPLPETHAGTPSATIEGQAIQANSGTHMGKGAVFEATQALGDGHQGAVGTATTARRRRLVALGGGVLALALIASCVLAATMQGSPLASLFANFGAGEGIAAHGSGQGTHPQAGAATDNGPGAPTQTPATTPTGTTVPPSTPDTAPATVPTPPGVANPMTPSTTQVANAGDGRSKDATPVALPTTAAELMALEDTLPTAHVSDLGVTFRCAQGAKSGSIASDGTICVRGPKHTRMTITVQAACAGTGAQVISLQHERNIRQSGVLRWSWQPAHGCAQGIALATISMEQSQPLTVLVVTRDPLTGSSDGTSSQEAAGNHSRD